MNQSVVLFMDVQHDLVKNPLMTNADRQYTYYTKLTWLSSSQRGQLADHWLVSKRLECKTIRKGDVCVVNCDMCMILHVIPAFAKVDYRPSHV